MSVIEVPRFNDLHVHLRQGRQLKHHIRHHERYADHVVAMPNTNPPLTDWGRILVYQDEIAKYATSLKAIVPLYLTEDTTVDVIQECADNGVKVAKLYPRGSTTGSMDGVRLSELRKLRPVFERMADVGMILSVHGEDPDSPSIVAEREFFDCGNSADLLVSSGGKVVFEHLTTTEGVQFVEAEGSNVFGTITVHHLFLTISDVVGSRVEPRNFCKPVAKTEEDRRELRHAVMGRYGHKFFFGSDSAPHSMESKKDLGSAGCWTPWVAELLVDWFWAYGGRRWSSMTRFATDIGAGFYGLPRPSGTLKFRKQEDEECLDRLSANEFECGTETYLPFGRLTPRWRIVE